MSEKYVIGYCMSEKKRQKFNWNDFHKIGEAEGFSLKMIDVNSNFESQGPFHIFLNKLAETTTLAEYGDPKAKKIISRIKQYFCQHPDIIVIDPLDNITTLGNRYKSYEIIQKALQQNDIFIPRFVEMKSKTDMNIQLLKMRGIKFPIVCKPLIAHGSSDAHKMMIIFNEKGLEDCEPPCVVQEFVNHNAIIYKLFVVGERFHLVERPSIKNFYEEDCSMLNTIFFHTHDVCKSGCRSKWSILSEKDIPLTVKPKYETLKKIVKQVAEVFGLILLGIDVVIENHTGRYAIIDVNVFPGYDGYPNFFEHLLDCIKKLLLEQRESQENSKDCTIKKCLSDDVDSGFESDEKKKYSAKVNK